MFCKIAVSNFIFYFFIKKLLNKCVDKVLYVTNRGIIFLWDVVKSDKGKFRCWEIEFLCAHLITDLFD